MPLMGTYSGRTMIEEVIRYARRKKTQRRVLETGGGGGDEEQTKLTIH